MYVYIYLHLCRVTKSAKLLCVSWCSKCRFYSILLTLVISCHVMLHICSFESISQSNSVPFIHFIDGETTVRGGERTWG